MRDTRRRLFRRREVQVLSLNVQAAASSHARSHSHFEILVRHFLGRMLGNEVLGDDAPARLAQLGYAIALPGLLVALFLFPAYHGLPPHPHERSYWSQADDHLFFATYAFVIMGMAMIFEWNALFPDTLDLYILSSLPLSRLRLLSARLVALVILLGAVHLGTSALGTLFLPAVADLHCGFWRHFVAHAAGVTLAGLFAAAFFCTLQSLLVCIVPGRVLPHIAGLAKAISVVVLLTLFFLFPLTAHFLELLLASSFRAVHFVPSLWSLAVYECVLWGASAPPIFAGLARTGIAATVGLCLSSALLYPLAYARTVAHQLEGTSTSRSPWRLPIWLSHPIDRLLLRSSADRAIFSFTWLTLLRLDRLQLYLSMYAGLGLALVLSELLAFRVQDHHVSLVITATGVRTAPAIISFWSVLGLRTALRAPVGQRGRWIFPLISGKPRRLELRGASTLVITLASTLILLATLLVNAAAPPDVRSLSIIAAQGIVGLGSTLLLADIAFLSQATIPFTEPARSSTKALPLVLVSFFIGFPLWVFACLQLQLWAEASVLHLLLLPAATLALHTALTVCHRYLLSQTPSSDDLVLLDLRF